MVRDGLASLGGHDRDIVVLAANGYRPEEIAGIIGCTAPPPAPACSAPADGFVHDWSLPG